MINKFRKLVEDFLFPVKCLNCGREGEFLCVECSSEVKSIEKGSCVLCGRAGNSTICPECRSKTSLDGLHVLGDYRDYILKKLIWDLKYNFIKEHADILADLLHKNFQEEILKDKSIITAVPLHKNRMRFRGFNQSELVARPLAGKMGMSFSNTLVRTKNTESQIMLTRFERQNNIRNAFSVCENVSGKNIYLVDDVITTGATISECSQALKVAGAKTVKAVVLARD